MMEEQNKNKKEVIENQKLEDQTTTQKEPVEKKITEEENPAEDISSTLEKQAEEIAQLKDRNLRLMAEFDNFRKRSQKEQSRLLDLASERVISALIPVLNDFERTLAVLKDADNLSALQKGVLMVNNRLNRILQQEGLERLNAKGEPFDPSLHEAISSVSVEGEDQKGLVIEEIEPGYKLKDKVIRYTKVIVGE